MTPFRPHCGSNYDFVVIELFFGSRYKPDSTMSLTDDPRRISFDDNPRKPFFGCDFHPGTSLGKHP
jgi:hypothetical protein